jgi:UDP-N-acetylglucosamine 1-carboxyvinyltransferase
MDAFVITGGTPLTGSVRIAGSKNAALPIMAAALLSDDPLDLLDVAELADIGNMRRLLHALGCDATAHDGALRLQVTDTSASFAKYDIVRTMRASICALGPLLARRGEARISLPGGCAIGVRPVDLHLKGMEALGARITLDSGDIVATAPPGGKLRGATIFLGGAYGPTVLGTANVMSAATLAHGRTVIESAACEPEIVDLAAVLTAMGARISGAGSPRITIDGVDRLHGARHRVMADRIEAGTYIMAGAIAGGTLTITNCPVDCLMAANTTLAEAGITVRVDPGATDLLRATVTVERTGPITPTHVTTQPHPGFPTDLQAQLMAVLTLAHGNSSITERIFPDRFMHMPELSRMGADLMRHGSTVLVSGVKRLVGAPVMASDLRASASLVLAGLAAQGQTIVRRVYHLDRGYERMENRLNAVGANIQRVDERELPLMD